MKPDAAIYKMGSELLKLACDLQAIAMNDELTDSGKQDEAYCMLAHQIPEWCERNIPTVDRLAAKYGR
jgi:hypothetical protein